MDTKTREAYLDKMKNQLDEWNAELDNFEERGQELSGEARQKYENQVQELRTQLNSMRSKLQEVREKGQDQWSSLASELEHFSKTFVQSFNYFKSQL